MIIFVINSHYKLIPIVYLNFYIDIYKHNY